jgi:hypothetical protein
MGGVDETFFEVKFKCVCGVALSKRRVHVEGGVGGEGVPSPLSIP